VLESLLTISFVGLVAGFILSMPLAGPISILITSNALKGRLRYCHRATFGASIADFVFVFIAVYGITKLYSVYRPFIPYILAIGSLFLLYVGYKIFKTNIDIEHIEEQHPLEGKIIQKDKGGFRTGFMISFLNPTLFLSWMTSSFFIISLVTSWGFNTGGLEKNVQVNYQAIHKMETNGKKNSKGTAVPLIDSTKSISYIDPVSEPGDSPGYFSFLLSLCYAFFIAFGSIIWFYYLSLFLSKFRHRFNINIVNRIVQGMGLILCLFGLFLGYKAASMLM